MTAKDIVLKFYESNAILSKTYLQEILHEDMVLDWTSSKGKVILDKNDVLALSKDIKMAYYSLRAVVHHTVEEDNRVVVHYTHYVRPFENAEEEMVLATYFVLWELQNNQLYKGIQLSQLVVD